MAKRKEQPPGSVRDSRPLFFQTTVSLGPLLAAELSQSRRGDVGVPKKVSGTFSVAG